MSYLSWLFKCNLDPDRAFLVAQTVKRLSTMWETRVQSLGLEDPLDKDLDLAKLFEK